MKNIVNIGSAVDHIQKEIEIEAARNILQALRGEHPSGAINGLFH